MTAAPDFRGDHPVGLDEKVAFLTTPDAYPDAPDAVGSIQTHMAWVFLTEQHAYKLKKPVAYDELDFTTLERRQWACAEEVRLNRRLAGDVYRGIVPLTTGPRGALHLGGDGEVVDWLVKMQRLPADRMLDALIEQGRASSEEVHAGVQAAVHKLTRMYAAASPIAFGPEAYVRHFHEQVRSAAAALMRSPYHIDRDTVQAVFEQQRDALRRAPDLLGARAREQHIVEGHGDLRPEHVCLVADPVVFDCIEFERALRVLDPVDELSFLGMECEYLGAPALGTLALKTYVSAMNDPVSDRLVHFYRSYRALKRAQIAVRHTRRPGTADEAKWSHQASAYLELATQYANRL